MESARSSTGNSGNARSAVVPHRLTRAPSAVMLGATLLVGALLPGMAPAQAAASSTQISVDGAGGGRVFDGVGALSAGASSQMLINYPEPERSQVLDYLFKPGYGAALQILKLEIGGDTNSTDGSESSHEHTATDRNFNRGYEWWLMEQAKARNPNIKIWGLEWGAPSWIGGICSQANAQYVADWVKGAESVHHVPVDYVGAWNERSCGSSASENAYIKLLRQTLDSNALQSVKIVAPDLFDFSLAGDMQADPELARDVYAIGAHYPGGQSSAQAKDSGYRLWSSEDGPWNSTAFKSVARTLNQNYANGRITSTTFWALESSYYPNLALPDAGLLNADEPWSGHYSVDPDIWAVAHTTQFAQPGWQYLDGASGLLPGGGSYVTLRSPNHSDWSTVIETGGSHSPQTVQLNTTGGLSASRLHAWRSSTDDYFRQLPDITPAGGSFTFTAEPNAIYSLTTTTGQHKGAIHGTIPPSAPFPSSYHEDFNHYSIGDTTPAYLSPQDGAFEIQPCQAGRPGNCLGQVVGAGTGQFNYTGSGWVSCGAGCDSGAYNDSFYYSNHAGDYVTFTFAGTGIRLYGLVDTNQGIGSVSIDGGPATDVDFYGTSRMGNQLLWQSPDLPAGVHTLRLEVTGRKDPQADLRAGGYYVVPDRVEVLPSGTSVDDQVTPVPIGWAAPYIPPSELIGDQGWTDYSVSVDALLPVGSGFTQVTGRVETASEFNGGIHGYQLQLFDDRTWKLVREPDGAVLATGTSTANPRAWHRLGLTFKGTTITAAIDGATVGTATDSTYAYGPVDFGGGWNAAQFSNLTIHANQSGTSEGTFVNHVSKQQPLRNNFGNYVGMQITTASRPLRVTELGRYFVPGNSGTHTLELIRARDQTVLASVQLNMAAGTPDSLGFKYATLNRPVMLDPDSTYYIVSRESAGGDQWYDGTGGFGAAVTTRDAIMDNGIWYDGSNWQVSGSLGESYGPLNFRYGPAS